MSNVLDYTILTAANFSSAHYLPVAGGVAPLRVAARELLPTFATAGTGGQNVYTSVSNGNQLNFKGLISGDTGLLTVDTNANNVRFTVLEAGIDLGLCNNTTSAFLSTVSLTANVTGTLPVANGGTNASSFADKAVIISQDSGTDTLSALALSTNGQLVIGGTSGPAAATLTEGSNVTITNGNGTISIAANISTLAANLSTSTYNINLDDASGDSWVSGDGTNEGMHIDANGRAFIGDSTPTLPTLAAQLTLGGNTATAIALGNTANYKDLTIQAITAPSSTDGLDLTISGAKGGATNQNGGDITLTPGDATGTGTGGTLNLDGGPDTAGSGTEGSVKIRTYKAGTATTVVTIDENQNTTFNAGNVVLGATPQTLTGAGAVGISVPITLVATTGANALTLADGAEGQLKYITMTVDGGDGTLTPSNLRGASTITFNDVGDSVSLLFVSGAWSIVGNNGATIA
jgi:hypothetical protein